MLLYRAIAYRLEHANVPPELRQPEVTVFFEAPGPDAAPARLLRLLALAWGCEPAELEFYNCYDEADLRASVELGPDAGDVALIVNGWYHGPLFCRADRTLHFVRPLTLERLAHARRQALPFHTRQRAAANAAAYAEDAARTTRLNERAEAAGINTRGVFSLRDIQQAHESEMGALC